MINYYNDYDYRIVKAYCHTSIEMTDDDEISFIEGKVYVFRYGDGRYEIDENEVGYSHEFSDDGGEDSFEHWFTEKGFLREQKLNEIL